jgi:hypothetical protein
MKSKFRQIWRNFSQIRKIRNVKFCKNFEERNFAGHLGGHAGVEYGYGASWLLEMCQTEE